MLAIVIPYFKISFFKETLQSLENQTNKNFKVYIGDDNSPNTPDDLLFNTKWNFNFEYKKFDNNLGSKSLVQQWNRCLAMVENQDWVMILGDDDVLEKNVVKEFYINLTQINNCSTVVRFSTQKINSEGNNISEIYKHPVIEKSTDFLFKNSRSSLSEYIFNRKILFDIGFKDFPLAWHSDNLAVLEFSRFENIYTINDEVIKIRISDESISGTTTNMSKKFEATFQFYFYLSYSKRNYFTVNQKTILLDRLTKAYINKKKNVLNFLKITFIHLRFYSISKYLVFIRMVLKNIFNKCA